MSPGWIRGLESQKWACQGPWLPGTGGAGAEGPGPAGVGPAASGSLVHMSHAAGRGWEDGPHLFGIRLMRPRLPLLQEAELERLEREFAIQSQITEAARRLASDPNVSKKLKKQRKTSYLNSLKKLQEIESAINENRVKSGKKPTQRASLIIDGQC